MSRRARARANARPWECPEALSLGPETDDDLEEGDDGEDEPIGDWSSEINTTTQATPAHDAERKE